MTAIVRQYILKGFVIAADGLKVHSESPALNVDTAQKIIRLDGKGKRLACSCSGFTQITLDDGEEMAIDFMLEAKTASDRLYYRTYRDLRRYAIALSDSISAKLEEIKRHGKITEYPGSPPLSMENSFTIAELFLDGFYEDLPSRVAIRFHHDQQSLLEPEILDQPFTLGNLIVQGPRTPGFMVLQRCVPHSLDEAVDEATRYINSCSDPDSKAIDPEACAKIGGHIHVATITKDAGFQWAIPPIVEEYPAA